jgi:hypothetical protein
MSYHHQRLLLYVEELTCFIFACACVCSFVCVCSFACVGSISLCAFFTPRKPGNVMTVNYEQTAAAPRVPVATPIATPIATPVVHHAPPPPPAPPAPPLSPPSSNGTKTAAKRSSTAKGSHDMEFKARSYACNEEFGFPENVTLSLARGHFTVLDEDKDDLASWPMNHVHDWSATGKHDIEVHVPEGTLEFGIEDPETFLTKLSIIHSALSGE